MHTNTISKLSGSNNEDEDSLPADPVLMLLLLMLVDSSHPTWLMDCVYFKMWKFEAKFEGCHQEATMSIRTPDVERVVVTFCEEVRHVDAGL